MSRPAMADTLPPPDLTPWRAGNTDVEGVWRFDSGRPGRQVLLTALVHGNEWSGAWGLAGLLQAGVRPQRGALVLAFCNLAAFDRSVAGPPDDARAVDEDLNRVWQADRLADPRTQERRRAVQLLPFAEGADWLLDLHSMHEAGPALQLAGRQPRHLALAQQLGTPGHVVVDAGHAEGTRLRDFGRFGLPDAEAGDNRSLLIECGGHREAASRRVAQDQCLRFLCAAGTLDEAAAEQLLPGWRQPAPQRQWLLEVTAAVVARSAGFAFRRPLAPLECLPTAGTVIADNDGEPVCTPFDDCVMVMPSNRPARPGITMVRLARRRALADLPAA
jgi:Succinylglutamate desuccinylase / Aspartoacylase family